LHTVVILDRQHKTELTLYLISFTAPWFEGGESVLARVAVITTDPLSAKQAATEHVAKELRSVYGDRQLDAEVDVLGGSLVGTTGRVKHYDAISCRYDVAVPTGKTAVGVPPVSLDLV